MTPFPFLLAALVIYRIARMIALEDGPFDVFSGLRGRVDPDQKTWVGRGINCPLCVGFWVALAVAFVFPITTPLAFVMLWWGLAGAQAAIQGIAG